MNVRTNGEYIIIHAVISDELVYDDETLNAKEAIEAGIELIDLGSEIISAAMKLLDNKV